MRVVIIEERDGRLDALDRAGREISVEISLASGVGGAPQHIGTQLSVTGADETSLRSSRRRDRRRTGNSPWRTPICTAFGKAISVYVAIVPEMDRVRVHPLGAREERHEVRCVRRVFDEVHVLPVGLQRLHVMAGQILPCCVVGGEHDRPLQRRVDFSAEQLQNALRCAAAALELRRLGLEYVVKRAAGRDGLIGENSAKRTVAGELKHLRRPGDLCHRDGKVVRFGAVQRLDLIVVDEFARQPRSRH